MSVLRHKDVHVSHSRKFLPRQEVRKDRLALQVWPAEEQEHLLRHCPMYDNIRDKYQELESDENLVTFFQEVLEKRDKVLEKEKSDREKEDKD